ncbi:MAG: biotin attachment protein [Helicobacteraceae bacterium]|jgi:pyruvate carboxylase subunit B|nr:biotin attachment protein [Helicobacteraceae bacterium]
MANRKIIEAMDTSYRDGFQSVFGARVFMKDFLPTVQSAIDAGIKHFEMGGGARFQALFFYLNENAFDMMDKFREIAGKECVLQTLSRGVNYIGLDTGSREIIDLHARLFKKHGVTTIRNFDALNDARNMEYSAKAIKDAGLNHELTVTVMDLPPGCVGAHDAAFYERTLKSFLDAGVPYDSVVFKDASGTANPRKVYDTISAARKLLGKKTHIRYHTHETAGIGLACYLAAIEADADGVDLDREPVSGGTAHTDILVMAHALKGSRFVLGNHLGDELNLDKVLISETILKEALKDYFIPPEATQVSAIIQYSPMPGGALTANTQMMRDNKCLDKFPAVIAEMREVVEKGGFGTSVTPVSQFYFQQAFNNVMFGKWKKIAEGYGRMALGYFGKTPVAPDPEIVKLASEQLKLPTTTENAIDIADRDEKKSSKWAKERLRDNNIKISDENIFIVLACGYKGITFLSGKAKGSVRLKSDVPPTVTSGADGETKANASSKSGGVEEFTVVVEGQTYFVKIAEGKIAELIAANGVKSAVENASAPPLGDKTHIIAAPMPGTITKTVKSAGDRVKRDELVLTMEAMKMENEIFADVDGVIVIINASVGTKVQTGQPLVTIAV